MYRILPTANVLAGLIGIVCCILVWVKMFRRGEGERAVIYMIVPPLLGFLVSQPPLCVVGLLLTWFRGVRKRTEWDLHKVMTGWSVCLLVSFLVSIAQFTFKPGLPPELVESANRSAAQASAQPEQLPEPPRETSPDD